MLNSDELIDELIKIREYRFAGNYDDEDAYNCETDTFDKRKIRVICPKCLNKSSPLCSKKTIEIDGGWRWVGCDHKEPYSTYKTVCRKCKTEYTFTVYTGQ